MKINVKNRKVTKAWQEAAVVTCRGKVVKNRFGPFESPTKSVAKPSVHVRKMWGLVTKNGEIALHAGGALVLPNREAARNICQVHGGLFKPVRLKQTTEVIQ